MATRYNLVDTSWELTDPNPDIHAMFVEFNREFFWGQLGCVEVKWSKRMTLCAGLCRYAGRLGLCEVVLSEPLLKLRPRKDLVETLLHEMIHAFLFVADGNREHDAHGPKFQSHMNRINQLTGTHITIYHSFHDEVNHYKTHWWKCDGPCQHRPPFFGVVKRSMNRKPGPNDFWFKDHQSSCGGTFMKIREPEAQPKKPAKSQPKLTSGPASHKIDEYFKIPSAPTSTFTPSSATSTSTSGTTFYPSTSAQPYKPTRKPDFPSTNSTQPKSPMKYPGFPSFTSAQPKSPAWKPSIPPSNSRQPKSPMKYPGFPGFTSAQPKSPAWKPNIPPSNSRQPKSPKKKPGPGSTSAQPKLPNWKPKPVPTQNPLPNNSKENGKGKNLFKGGSVRSGTATAGGSRTVTVITIDDDDNTPRTGLNNHNVNSNVSRPNMSTSVSGGAVRNPEQAKPTGFVPFSGKGYTLGGGSDSPDKKRPRY